MAGNYLSRNPGERVRLPEALRILRAQLEKTDVAKAPQTWSLGLVLLAVGEDLLELKSDVALRHNKLQPVLRELQEGQIKVDDLRKGPKRPR
jgi:hypothetical protein